MSQRTGNEALSAQGRLTPPCIPLDQCPHCVLSRMTRIGRERRGPGSSGWMAALRADAG
jgi:hypothetical protein